MSTLGIYAVHDYAAEVYHNPFCAPNDAVARRGFEVVVNNPEHPFGQHPDDYSLFRVGTFDQHTGMCWSENGPENLGNGRTFVKREDDK